MNCQSATRLSNLIETLASSESRNKKEERVAAELAHIIACRYPRPYRIWYLRGNVGGDVVIDDARLPHVHICVPAPQ